MPTEQNRITFVRLASGYNRSGVKTELFLLAETFRLAKWPIYVLK